MNTIFHEKPFSRSRDSSQDMCFVRPLINLSTVSAEGCGRRTQHTDKVFPACEIADQCPLVLNLGIVWRWVSSRFTFGKRVRGIHWRRDWIRLRAGLDAIANSCWKSNLVHAIHRLLHESDRGTYIRSCTVLPQTQIFSESPAQLVLGA
jgi:hypothetical protein